LTSSTLKKSTARLVAAAAVAVGGIVGSILLSYTQTPRSSGRNGFVFATPGSNTHHPHWAVVGGIAVIAGALFFAGVALATANDEKQPAEPSA
jgi:hypothetical protein